jgi:hypothetical protein
MPPGLIRAMASPLAIDEVVSDLLRRFAAGPLRVAAEVCSCWHRVGAAAARRRQRQAPEHQHDWSLPPELSYYLQSPGLLLWGCDRFAALEPLRCLAAAPGDAPAWAPEVAAGPLRRWAAWVLHRSPCPLGEACSAAHDLEAAFELRRREKGRSPGGTPKYTPAHHQYARLKHQVGSGPSAPRPVRASRARCAGAKTEEGPGADT